jgi:hypothetical protein
MTSLLQKANFKKWRINTIFSQWVQRLASGTEKPVVVTFTGGMGAQIISAAIYFSLKNDSRMVYADLSYFNQAERVATMGKLGDCSHWSWQLEPFGLSITSFETAPAFAKYDRELIVDGPQKMELGLRALRQPEIQKYFRITVGVDDILPQEFSSGYLCIHVRRGDYVNVASHLITDNEFIELSGKFSGLVKRMVVVSDSPIDEHFRLALAAGYEQVEFLDDIDAFTSHRVMRNARILICSNSQFSLIGAILNSHAFVLLPKQWFGTNDRAIEVPIHEFCSFQLMNSVH